jgi:hypothetical protein
MLQVSCPDAQVKEQEQQQAAVAASSAAEPNDMVSDSPPNTRTPPNVQVFSFESGSDGEAAAGAAADTAAGGWFRFYDASLDDEPDAPAVEDLVAQLVRITALAVACAAAPLASVADLDQQTDRHALPCTC